jgi:hypothetical protein
MHLKTLGIPEHNPEKWEVEFYPEFLTEFEFFAESVRRQTYLMIELLRAFGPKLGRPYVDTLKGSVHANLKELRFHADHGAWRVAFAFDTRRKAILLVAGDKAGISKTAFYRSLIGIADRRFDQHLRTLAKEKR